MIHKRRGGEAYRQTEQLEAQMYTAHNKFQSLRGASEVRSPVRVSAAAVGTQQTAPGMQEADTHTLAMVQAQRTDRLCTAVLKEVEATKTVSLVAAEAESGKVAMVLPYNLR